MDKDYSKEISQLYEELGIANEKINSLRREVESSLNNFEKLFNHALVNIKENYEDIREEARSDEQHIMEQIKTNFSDVNNLSMELIHVKHEINNTTEKLQHMINEINKIENLLSSKEDKKDESVTTGILRNKIAIVGGAISALAGAIGIYVKFFS